MRLLIDQDEVIVRWLEPILREYNLRNGTAWIEEEIKTWEITETLPNSRDLVTELLCRRHFYLEMKPVDGAVKGIRNLIEMGHDVIILTATPKFAPIAYEGKINWIKAHLPFFPFDNVISAKRKELISGNILLDDRPDNIEKFPFTKHSHAVVFDRPWNRLDVCPQMKKYDMVTCWNDFVEYIEYLS